MSTGPNSLARNRWSLLQEAIRKKRIPEPRDNPASKRVFDKFADIVNWSSENADGELRVDVTVRRGEIGGGASNKFANSTNTTNSGGKYVSSRIQSLANINDSFLGGSYAIWVSRNCRRHTLEIDDLRGYDKTGRICIWPAEQVLAYWCLKNAALWEAKSVVEIGGGFHCLAGLGIAKFTKAKEVLLTDGDPSNVEDIKRSLRINGFLTKSVLCNLLRWDSPIANEYNNKFDVVIAADIIYDSTVYEPLIKAVAQLLKSGGQFILFNPTRVEKLKELVDSAKRSHLFQDILIHQDFDSHITELVEKLKTSEASFNKDWHYPVQLIFTK